MLRGQFPVTIDDKGRLVMPSRFLSAFSLKQDEKEPKIEQETEEVSESKDEEDKKIKGRLVIAPDMDLSDVNSSKRLLVYPLEQWEAFERDWDAQDEKDEDKETLLASATPADLDMKGRFALPGYLVKHIGFELKELSKEKFCLIGKKNKLELWKKELWDEECCRANAALKEKQEIARRAKEIIRKREEVKKINEKIRLEAAEEVINEEMKELMEKAKARKEAMKKEMKEALFAGQKNQTLEELVKGLQGFKM